MCSVVLKFVVDYLLLNVNRNSSTFFYFSLGLWLSPYIQMLGKSAPFPLNLVFHQYRIRVMIATTTPTVSESPKSSPSYRQVITKSSPSQPRPQPPPGPVGAPPPHAHLPSRPPSTHYLKPAALSSCTVHHPRSTDALSTHSNSSRPPTREAFTSKLEWALGRGEGEGFP